MALPTPPTSSLCLSTIPGLLRSTFVRLDYRLWSGLVDYSDKFVPVPLPLPLPLPLTATATATTVLRILVTRLPALVPVNSPNRRAGRRASRQRLRDQPEREGRSKGAKEQGSPKNPRLRGETGQRENGKRRACFPEFHGSSDPPGPGDIIWPQTRTIAPSLPSPPPP